MDTALNAFIGYTIIIVIAIATANASSKKTENQLTLNAFLVLAIFIYSEILFGFRSLNFGTSDQYNYLSYFHNIRNTSYGQIFEGVSLTSQTLFSITFKILSDTIGDSERSFFICTTILYVVPIIFFCRLTSKKLFGIVLFFYISSFYFYSPGITVMRHGFGLSFGLISVHYFLKKKYLLFLLFFLISVGFHSSSYLSALGLIISYFLTIKRAMIVWFISLLLSFLEFNLAKLFNNNFFLNLNLENNSSNVKNNLEAYQDINTYFDYSTGFRYGFFFFSLVFVLLGAYIYFIRKFRDENFIYYFKNYLILNSIFILSFGLPFCDRYGLYCWFLIPPLLANIYLTTTIYKRGIIYSTIIMSAFGLLVILYVYNLGGTFRTIGL